MKQTVPTLNLIGAVNRSGLSARKLANWEEVDRWAFENQPLWNLITKENEMLGLTEEERLKTLAVFYMRRYVELSDEYADYRLKNPAAVVGPNGEVWRYTGP